MEKKKLSDLIAYYQHRIEEKDVFFGLYFEENDLKSKLEKLKLMYKVLGDVVLPLDYFKTFLYAGHWYGNKQYFVLSESMILDIYDIIKKYDDMPISIIDDLIFHYNKLCFEKFPVKENFDLLVSEYKFTEETSKKCIEYIEECCKKIKDFYENESDKLQLIADQYPYEFIQSLRDIITTSCVTYDDLIKRLPLNSMFKPTIKNGNEFWAKYNDYRFMIELLKGNVDLQDYQDDEYMVAYTQIGQGDRGIECRKMYTTFTKEEYMNCIKAERTKQKLKGSN